MKLLRKYYYIIPAIVVMIQLIVNLKYNFKPTITPSSDKNNFLQQLTTNLNYLNLKPQNIIIRQFQSEVEINLPYPVIFSTEKNLLTQITALQKLIEIANIKQRNIQFIDLSSSRPYATL